MSKVEYSYYHLLHFRNCIRNKHVMEIKIYMSWKDLALEENQKETMIIRDSITYPREGGMSSLLFSPTRIPDNTDTCIKKCNKELQLEKVISE